MGEHSLFYANSLAKKSNLLRDRLDVSSIISQ